VEKNGIAILIDEYDHNTYLASMIMYGEDVDPSVVMMVKHHPYT
jgi:hypothetical protein